MPTRLCLTPRCPNPSTHRGRCPQHSRQRNRETHTDRRIYNTARWKHTREQVLFDQPLCQCPDPTCTEIATDVDHIVAIEEGGNPWARSNLQALAHQCHARKTRQEQA